MVNRKLRQDLLALLRVTPQALSYRAKRVKERYGPMTTEEAVYVIAHLEGLDVSKYLPLAAVDRVRALVPRGPTSPSVAPTAHPAKRGQKRVPAKAYPLLSTSLTARAHVLGHDVFPQLFQLENSIRAIVHRKLSGTGNDWWTKRVPSEVQRAVQRTMDREKRYPYRDPRGNHPLYYSNFDDLKKIILHPPNQSDFRPVILDLDWFRVKMEEVYMARNNLAHCVPLSQDDVSRILLFHRDWARLIDAAGLK